MRSGFPQRQALSVLAAFALAAGLCAELPQEAKVPHFQARMAGQNQSQRPVQAPMLHRSLNTFPGNTSQLRFYPGTRTVVPPGWVRCTSFPDTGYWGSRDLMAEIQWISRTGFVPVSPIGDGVSLLSDYVPQPAGWRAYGVSVPAGGTVQLEVQHPMLGWFRLMLVDRWGVPAAGMLQASTAYRPVLVTYRNPGKEATAVYVIVDDPAWWSDARAPYTLVVRRDWDPAHTDLSQVKMVAGLWGASPSVNAEFRRPSLTGPAVYPH